MNGSTVIHQLAEQGPKIQMMSFVIQAREDCLIVIDGGNETDAEYLLEYLRTLGGAKPVIAAWFLTHAHADHIDAFMKIMNENPDSVEILGLYCSFPPAEYIEQYEAHEAHTVREFGALMPSLGIPVTVMREGDDYVFDQVSFKVLYTFDPSYTFNAINNSGTVLRMESGGQSVLFLADIGIEAGNKLLRMYSAEELKSDFVQMAHHGQSGVTREVYKAAAPSACLWCTPQWLWDNNAGKGYDTHTWQTIIVQGWMNELGVRHHFVTKDGTHAIVLPMAF